MELVQDLVWTASVALILSFFVAKLVAMATSDHRESQPFNENESVVTDGGVEERMRVQEVYQSQRSVQEADRFEEKPVTAVVGVVEKSDDGGEVSVDSERRRGEEIAERRQVDAESARNDIVKAVEVKLGSYSDEDDWEGIERSELDEGYNAAVKSEGG